MVRAAEERPRGPVPAGQHLSWVHHRWWRLHDRLLQGSCHSVRVSQRANKGLFVLSGVIDLYITGSVWSQSPSSLSRAAQIFCFEGQELKKVLRLCSLSTCRFKTETGVNTFWTALSYKAGFSLDYEGLGWGVFSRRTRGLNSLLQAF